MTLGNSQASVSRGLFHAKSVLLKDFKDNTQITRSSHKALRLGKLLTGPCTLVGRAVAAAQALVTIKEGRPARMLASKPYGGPGGLRRAREWPATTPPPPGDTAP